MVSHKANGSHQANGFSNGHARSVDIQLNLAASLLHGKEVKLTGYDLSLGGVVAGARDGREVTIDETKAIVDRIDGSVAFLKSKVCHLHLVN